ncbi:MAG: sulfurtransferase complex subunit TusB [Methylococcales bacterium]|nr:sulfurtransferase complex subunit TusB [Methylococcales bacterium]
MLHLISQSPIETAVFERVAVSDELVFLDNAVLRLLQQGELNQILSVLLKNHRLYVLTDTLKVRGIRAEELVPGISVIDYPQLVALTVKHSVIQSWS